MSILACPFCAAPLTREGKSFYCSGEKRHCFDIAKSGYVSLTRASGTSGDDRDMVRARTAFLDTGYYAPFADAVAKAAAGASVIIDAGCGEGYYANRLAGSAAVFGFDLSKHACDHAAKRAKAAGTGAFFGVASVFELPLGNGTVDAVVNVFAPCAEDEFCRVLRPGGLLVLLGAGERHLLGLKQALYDETYENAERADLPSGMQPIEQRTVRDTVTVVGKEQIANLFSMTPYYWRTSPSDKQKLEALDTLTTEIE